jgi:glutamyl-tRNA synthetase
MTVVTRFAPSPTGTLHIGGARTAFFNWLFARHHGGRFLLRIEDTDRARSTDDFIEAIYNGLRWLGLDWDGDPISQFARAERHREVVRELLDRGQAYHCFATQDELAAMRDAAKQEGRPLRYDGRWRDRDPAEAPPGIPPVVRLKAPQAGETRIVDLVQGEIIVDNAQLDDMVLLRADGTPTYMLAVVVDDHDMGITHVIRGDDHLTNTFRQYQLYRALDWPVPAFAHIPLIHGADGAKLSKRHGALGVDAYRDLGFLPDAVCNYLLRLGWSHGDDEIISRAQATAWFSIEAIGRSAARFDMAKLTNLNAHYLRQSDDRTLAGLVLERLKASAPCALAAEASDRLVRGMPSLKVRAQTLNDLTANSAFYACAGPVPLSPEAEKALTTDARAKLGSLADALRQVTPWQADAIERALRDHAEATASGLTLRDAAKLLRAVVTGAHVSPPLFEVLEVLGRAESLARLAAHALSPREPAQHVETSW